MSDGEMNEYFAAEMSGEYGEFGVNVVVYKCPKCENHMSIEYL
ncbi:MAG: hypothetical protein Q8J68_03840 [Methanolobus sp.]|nr:hypothetical protein [Methanolobus sp.]MDP2216403.1 hypothetical protein [Methanolobus sp.]